MDVSEARTVIRDAFVDDPDFRRTYVDNLAMLLYDKLGVADSGQRDQVADSIVKLIFES